MNLFQQFLTSLYQPQAISRFRNQKMGKTILYLLLLTFLTFLPSLVSITQMLPTMESSLTSFIQEHDLHSFEIQNGELVSKKTEPIVIKEDNLTVLLDSTGEISKTELKYWGEEVIAFLQKDMVVYRNEQTQSMHYQDGLLHDFTILQMESWLPRLLPVIGIVILLYAFSSLMVQSLLFVTIYAAIGMLATAFLNQSLRYKQLWKMSAYAITLVTVFLTTMDFFQISLIIDRDILRASFTLFYLILAIRAIPKKEHSQTGLAE